MKPKSAFRSFLLLSGSTLLAVSPLRAATFYWDINGSTTTNTAATGTWTAGSTANWTTVAAGNIATAAVTTTSGDDLIFSASGMTAGTVTVDNTQVARSITFGNVTNQVYTISGGTAIGLGNSGGGSGVFNVTSANQTINTPVILDSAATALTFGNFTNNTLTLPSIAGSAPSGTQALTAATNSGNLTFNGAISDGAGGGNVSLTVNNLPGATAILAGTNTYTGTTRVDSGTLKINSQVSLYDNGSAAAWSKDNIIVGNGATLAFNVGGAGFTKANLETILALSDSGTNGFGDGSTLGIDTTNGNFVFDSVLADTNNGNNVLGLTKLGANTLTLDQTNTYTGGTTIGSGTLDVQGSIATSSGIINNAALVFNSGSSQSYDNTIIGTGTLAKQGSGTLTLGGANTFTGTTTPAAGTLDVANPLALQNSAVVTTGAGTITLTGVTTPVFGGLSGATGDLGAIISGGYSGVTALTLNPGSGTLTYGGVIADGAAGMSLVKSGTGTQALQGENTYTGITTIRGGNVFSGSNPVVNAASGTLTLSGGSGSLAATSGVALEDDGILRMTNTTAQTAVDRVNGNAITVTRGGSILWENTSGNDITYAETLGAITHASGQLNIGLLNNQAGTGTSAQTLTLGGLTPAGTATATFSAATTGPQASGNKNMIVVTAAGSTGTGDIAGPWATTGTTPNIQTDYAVYSSDHVTAAGITANNDETTWTAGQNVNINGAVTLTATRTLNTLRDSAAAANTLTLGENHLETRGILGACTASGTFTITGTGSVRTPSGGGNLYVTTGAQAITVSAPITDDSAGTGATTLVKSGSGGSLANNNYSTQGTLVLNGVSTYTGDTIINAGTLRIGTNNTANGAKLGGASGDYAGNITIGAGAILYVSTNANQTLSGNISGAGTLMKSYNGTLTLSGNNTYTGRTTISPATTSGAGVLSVSSFNSVVSGSMETGMGTVATPVASSSLGAPGTVFHGTIDIGGPGAVQGAATLRYTGLGETTDRVINFHFGSTTSRTIENNGPGLLKFTSPVTFSNFGQAGPTTITLGGTGNGELVWGLPCPVSHAFSKTGNGTWTLGGPVGTGGTITISAGTLILNGNKLGSGAVAVNGTSTLGGKGIIGGTVTVAAGAKLSPGASAAGTMSFPGSLNVSAMAGGVGTLNMDLGPIAASDKIVAGSVNIGELAFNDFNFSALGGIQNGTYVLIQSGGITGSLDPDAGDLTGAVGTGTGTLQVNGNNIELVISGITGGGDPYDTWSGGAAFGDDANGDGVENGLAWVLGAADVDANAVGLLPTFDNSTDPDFFVFNYRRKDDAATDADTTIKVEYCSDLATWTEAVAGVDIVITPTDDIEPGVDSVEVMIRRTLEVGGKLFARLSVTKAP